MRMSVADAMTPMIGAVSKPVQDAATFVRNISGLSELQGENERLQNENARLREWYQTALLLEAENKSLRELLNVKLEPQSSYITARILSDVGSAFAKSLLVDAGLGSGVKKNQPVISGEGLVGRVIEVGNKAARVLLITDINSRVPVLIEGSNQHAILAGHNEAVPTLSYLPPDTEIKQGARVVTSGHGGLFPQGLPVGKIVMGEDGAYGVELFADFNRMVYVRMVERPYDSNLVHGALD